VPDPLNHRLYIARQAQQVHGLQFKVRAKESRWFTIDSQDLSDDQLPGGRVGRRLKPHPRLNRLVNFHAPSCAYKLIKLKNGCPDRRGENSLSASQKILQPEAFLQDPLESILA
jgi:tRNA G37 N-methylase TrmD